MSSLTIVCPNARRCVIKVTPGTPLRQAVEEACLKQGYEANKVEARNAGRLVDLSLPFRLSGLPNNATIELTSLTSAVSISADIALQLPDGTRNQLTFCTESSLEHVVSEFAKHSGQALLSTDDGIPSIMYMNRQYTGDELKQTTLFKIGAAGGKHLLRFSKCQLTEEQKAAIDARVAENERKLHELSMQYEKMKNENEDRDRLEAERQQRFEEEIRLRKEQEPATDNLMDVSESPGQMTDNNPLFADRLPTPPPVAGNTDIFHFNLPDRVPSISSTSVRPASSRLEALTRMLNQTESSTNLSEILANEGRIPLSTLVVASEEMETEAEPSNVQPIYPDPCERRTVYFSREELLNVVPQQEVAVDDSFYDVGADDLKSMQKDLRQQVNHHTNRALLPKEFIDRKNRDLKIAAYKHSVLRFTIGSVIVQANFLSAEPSSRIFEFISNILPNVKKISLKFAWHEDVENSTTKNLVETNCAPNSSIILKVEIDSIEQNISGLTHVTKVEADSISSDWLSVNTTFRKYTGVEVAVENRISKRPGTDYKPSATSPVPAESQPKWFKH